MKTYLLLVVLSIAIVAISVTACNKQDTESGAAALPQDQTAAVHETESIPLANQPKGKADLESSQAAEDNSEMMPGNDADSGQDEAYQAADLACRAEAQEKTDMNSEEAYNKCMESRGFPVDSTNEDNEDATD